jgi:hypothetical protein
MWQAVVHFGHESGVSLKLLCVGPKSCAQLMTYPISMGVFPIVVLPRSNPKKWLANERGLTLTTSAPNPIAIGGLLRVIQPRSNPNKDTVNEVRTSS